MLRIFGDGGGEAPGSAQGSVWTLTGSGALLTYDGASTLTGFQLESIKLRTTNKSPTVGLNLSHSFVNHLRFVVFEGFGNVATPLSNATDARLSSAVDSSAGLLLSGAYTDSVVTFVFGCSFLHNAIGISSPMENGNMLDISTSYFYTNGYGIRSGPFFTKWNVRGCNMEGNTLADLYTSGGARGLTYTDNYHEMIPHRPFIVIDGASGSPHLNGPVLIEGNTFNGDPGPGRGIIETCGTSGLRVLGNWQGVSLNASNQWLVRSTCPQGVRTASIERPSGPFDTPGFELVATLFDGTQTYSEGLVTLMNQPLAEGGGVRIEGLNNPVIEGTIAAQAATFASTVRMSGATIFATHTPASSSEACQAGQVAWDEAYVYVCVAANKWKRTALASW